MKEDVKIVVETKKEVSKQAEENNGVKKEIQGRSGPEPTRYGDWEKNGRCIDF